MLQMGKTAIVLEQFAEERAALLYNIEGNNNYGASFVTKVKAALQSFYEADAV